ncbi:hypothetical protein SRABI128_04804 [Microbacterium sp. Bi128]|nr:hypothetical protein SRABI128_04804 [Microbacterium sp. Bi128]
MRCRLATALATTSAMSSRPLMAATAESGSATAVMPGISRPRLAMTTPVSPSEGSTRSMYFMKDDVGPTSRTPALLSRSRCV